MNKNIITKLTAFLLCLALICTILPISALTEVMQEPDLPVEYEINTPDDEDEIITPDDGEEEEVDIYANAVDVSNGSELAEALEEEAYSIRITADFQLDQTFYVTGDTVIFSQEAHTLTRARGFGGDIFVVGERKDGTFCENAVKLTLGDPESTEKNLLVIDGNRDKMDADVTGTIIFVVSGASADLYENVTIKNNKKVGNEKTLTEQYGVSYVGRVGGAVAILSAKTTMNIYGGTYSDNAVNDVTNSTTEEGQVSTQGGAIYNFGTLNIYGGTFENNYAARGGVFYCYRTTNIFNADIKNNTASDMGGVVYMPNSTGAHLFLGGENPYGESHVTIQNNTSDGYGGAIYARNELDIQNTDFIGNSVTSSSGGAIAAFAMEVTISNSSFKENTAASYGAAIYYASENGKDTPELTVTGTVFENNSVSSSGGAVYMNGNASAYMENVKFTGNTSENNGGAIYLNNGHIDVNGAVIENNSCGTTGGAITGNNESSIKLNEVTATNNISGKGGFVYCNASSLHIYDSMILQNNSTGGGGGVYLDAGASGGVYATTFHKNTTDGNGGALFIYTDGYTAETKVTLHSCTYTNNESDYGGAIYASSRSVIDLYNSTAKYNAAKKGGFLYHTTTNTIINLASLILEGNTATDGGPIIWGNSAGAVLNLDKALYIDRDVTGELDDAYWASAIVNKLKVNQVVLNIPNYIGYDGAEVVPQVPRIPVDITSAQELEKALADGKDLLRIAADFKIDRTFYIYRNTTIYSEQAHTLTRASGFGGDIFVVGEYSDGDFCENEVKLTLGDPESTEKNLLVIDGNRDNMTADVIGTVIFVVSGASADLYENVTIQNHKKVGNEKTLTDKYGVSYVGRIGGAVAILSAKTSMNIYGGTYLNNAVNDITDSNTEEGQVSTQGGAIYNFGTLNVYGGTFEKNYAARGGVFYCYRTTNIFNADIKNNTSSDLGGVVYMPNSTSAFLNIGTPNDLVQSKVIFTGNTAGSHGGVIYARNVLEIQNAEFIKNTASSGGAIISYNAVLNIRDSIFRENVAEKNGGAIYISGHNTREEDNDLTATGCGFISNTAASNGGAIYLTGDAVVLAVGSIFRSNSAANGGAVYSTGSRLDVDTGFFTDNIADSNGGAVALYTSSTAVLNKITATGNSAKIGGFGYGKTSALTVYRSKIEKNTSHSNGGGIALYDDASANIYATDFTDNTAEESGNGGALFLYTNNGEVLIHSCNFTGNHGAYGGAIYASNKSIAKIYNITAGNNTATKGGFLYHTTTGTIITLVGVTVSGNTATDGGPIIWGNSTGAVLYLDKAKFTDSDYTGTQDSAYWSSAIVNKLKVNEISEEIPKWLDYQEESYEHMADAVDVSTAEQLEKAIASGAPFIRVISDIEIDRTFYITGNTTIFSTLPRKLTRAPSFGGDMFVVGENDKGTSALLLGSNAKLVLGNPLSKQENLLIIDGNKDNMTVPVKGSALFISYSSSVDLHINVTAQNMRKTDNERTHNECYNLSRPNRIGGTLAIVASGTLNIYGGIYRDNLINEEDASSEETRNSTIGGLLYNNSNVYIHGGTFENNQAARGGIIYNYRVLKIYGGSFINNVATVNGGVAYAPNLAASHTHIGSADADGAQVIFRGNSSNNHGGAIYSSSLCTLVIHGNTTFEGNTTNYSGGAICSYGQLTARDTVFTGNTAKNQGGAVYAANSSDTYVTRINNFDGCTFENNQAALGGALSVYSSNKEFTNGGIATVTDCQFVGNQAASLASKSATSYGGAIYVERKSSLTVKETVFRQNSARTEGGAVYAAGASEVSVSNTDFTENTILDNGKHGGAISIHSVTMDITSVNFTNNTAITNGGALYVSYSSSYDQNSRVTLTDSDFTGNATEKLGGAMYVTKQAVTEENRILTADNTSFTRNSASEGGAMFFVSGTTAYMTDMTFAENVATESGGGAIATSGGNLELDTASFTGNTSVGAGAAIFLENQAEMLLYNIDATDNAAEISGGFLYGENCKLTVYDSLIKKNTAASNAGGIALYGGAAANIYATDFVENTSVQNGGGLFLYTDLKPCIVHTCTFTGNSGVYGGAIYASGKAVASLYNISARDNISTRGGFLYHTTTGTELTMVGTTVSGNTASDRGPIIWGNSTGAVLNLDKTKFIDEKHSGELNADYWTQAIVNKLTVNDISASVPEYDAYESKRDTGTTPPATKDPVSVQDVFSLAEKSSDASINSTYDKLPKLDNTSNFMSKNVTTFKNINGGTVTVDSFIYPTYGTADNCSVGEGLLIYQAMCYKKAHPEEEVYIDISSYRFSVQAAVNINRNSRYFGYMRNLSGNLNYDQFGFMRISYLLVSAAKMGIHINAIGHIDAYPVTSNSMNMQEYFAYYLNDPCDTDYVQNGVIGDYLNFCKVEWSLDQKGGTDMMHTKLCAVSHYLDMNGVSHRNAVWTSSSNLDGINSAATNGNWKQQTASIVTGHEAIYRTSVNYLRMIPKYQGQEEVYEFQHLINSLSTEQAQMIMAGRESEIPADRQIIYLGRDTDPVFELYFTPMGGDILTWDEVHNPYCKYLRKLYDSEDYIIFTWNAAEYNGNFALGRQIENMIIAAFHDNRNVNNKIYGNMEHFDITTFDDLQVGVDIGVKSLNELEFGEVHNKDVQFSYVENGQRYYVSLLNSMNMHGGSMYYQSNFALVIKETDCNEDSVFFTLADETTSGIVEHAYSDEVLEYIPETMHDGYTYHPCANCDKKLVLDVIHRASDWIEDRPATSEQNGIAHRSCMACDILLETREYVFAGEEVSLDLSQSVGKTFANEKDPADTVQIESTPYTIEATIHLDKGRTERGGVIVGNYDNSVNDQLNLEVYTYGRIRLFLSSRGQRTEHIFKTDIRSDKAVHVAVTVEGRTASLYINGKLTETATLALDMPVLSGKMHIGGDNRTRNTQYFKGTIYGVALFSDVRTEEEILRDAIAVFPEENGLLALKYFEQSEPASVLVKPVGKTFTAASENSAGTLAAAPHTIEATVQIPLTMTERAGVIFGNYDGTAAPRLNLEVYELGRVRLYLHNGKQSATYTFPTDIRSEKPVHIAVTMDGLTATLYVNGEAKSIQTLSYEMPNATEGFRIGGDNRSGNTQYFKGTIYSVNVFSSVRTPQQLKKDMALVTVDTDDLLFSRYFAMDNDTTKVDSVRGITFSEDTSRSVDNLASTPRTIEATVQLNKSYTERGGVIVGNYDGLFHGLMNLEIYYDGLVRLYYSTDEGVRQDCVFDSDIRSNKAVHIAVTIDGLTATLYLDGEAVETKELTVEPGTATDGYKVGGDNRTGNTQYFKGTICNVALFGDVRTPEEIRADMNGISDGEEDLLYTQVFERITARDPLTIMAAGKQFTTETTLSVGNLSGVPVTMEAVVQVDKSLSGRAGVIVGNYDGLFHELMNLEIYSGGKPRLYYASTDGTRMDCTFNTDIRSEEAVHIAVTIDGLTASLYINGVLTEQKTLPFALPVITDSFKVGGDNRQGNTQYFKGTIYSVSLFSDVRTEQQIRDDLVTVNTADPSLLYNVMFVSDPCAQNGHVSGEWIRDLSITDTSYGIRHTECVNCSKLLQCIKSPHSTDIVEHIVFANKDGLHTDAQTGGYRIEDGLAGAPYTFEATIWLDRSYSQRAGVIMGNYDGSAADQINLEVYTNGKLRLYYKVNGVAYTYNFKTDIRSNIPIHIALTVDGLTAKLYINGKLTETATLTAELPAVKNNFVVGSDNRQGNAQYFKGTIYTACMFSDVRTAEEIAVDHYMVPGNTEDLVFAKSFLTEN